MTEFDDVTAKALELTAQVEEIADVHRRLGLGSETETAYRFYEGDQWRGLESGGEKMPIYNFIAPVIRYKTANIAMNSIAITYSCATDPILQSVCTELTRKAAVQWERFKMDSKCWDIIKSAMIAGDSYIYFYDGEGECQVIDRTDIFFGDETERDINKQPAIFIKERKNVLKLRDEARKNGVSEKIALTIIPDSEQGTDDKDKCTGYLKMWLEGEDLHFTRFTKTAVYQPEQVIAGLGCYPVASLVFGSRRGLCRGMGEVTPMIPNQIEINRNLARRLLNAKLTAYSRLVYASDRIQNPSALSEVGSAIEVDGGGVATIKDAVCYLTPSSMSPDAKLLSDELLTVSKELAGAGDAALGHIDPTQASGSAIIAVRDQAALPLNEQVARFRQFAEDIAFIWYRLWAVYGATGKLLKKAMPDIRVDIANASPFSKYAREQALERLFSSGHISFDEYVEALDDDSSAPKSKLTNILKKRGGITNVDTEN